MECLNEFLCKVCKHQSLNIIVMNNIFIEINFNIIVVILLLNIFLSSLVNYSVRFICWIKLTDYLNTSVFGGLNPPTVMA